MDAQESQQIDLADSERARRCRYLVLSEQAAVPRLLVFYELTQGQAPLQCRNEFVEGIYKSRKENSIAERALQFGLAHQLVEKNRKVGFAIGVRTVHARIKNPEKSNLHLLSLGLCQIYWTTEGEVLSGYRRSTRTHPMEHVARQKLRLGFR
jgi:hypothetical protein